MTYVDALHIYAVSRAGYVPQICTIRLPNPVVIYELLQKANARVLICDSSSKLLVQECPVPVHFFDEFDRVDPETVLLLELVPVADGNEIAMIFHTSGSTSGIPKLVPCSYSWLSFMVNKAGQTSYPKTPGKLDVTVWMGSMSHIAQNFSNHTICHNIW
jgi:acyl-coenzyme A synthetase/AMP-(fatty) acid ligase